MKDHLIFDTTSAATMADTDSVGAYLRASDGTLLTHTDVGGKKALDVRVAEGINVEVDLNFSDDSVTAHQGGTWIIDSITNAVTVTANNLDIRDLTHVSDSVRLGDGTSFFTSTTVGSDVGLDVNILNDASMSNVAIAHDATALVATTEAEVGANLANRKYLNIYNNGNRKVFVGATGVTDASGFPLSPGSYLELRAGAAIDVYCYSLAACDVRTLELS